MSVGDRIKHVRNFRGLTQREMGIRAGFDENTADVRINQYEAGLRKPKEEILTRIADALEVNYRSLYEPTFYTAEDIMYTLFEMDEHFNIRLHEVPDENFSSRKHYAIQIRYPVAESFLQEWDLRKKNLLRVSSASPNILNGNSTGHKPPTTAASILRRSNGGITLRVISERAEGRCAGRRIPGEYADNRPANRRNPE